MAKNKRNKGDVQWYVPKYKKPIAHSTVAAKKLVGILADSHETIIDVYNAISYDAEAKAILKKYIDLGYGKQIAKEWFTY